MTAAAVASAASRAASGVDVASGFSQMTCFQAWIAASANSRWVAFGVTTCTTSMVSSARSSAAER